MKTYLFHSVAVVVSVLIWVSHAEAGTILIVSSYHPENIWTSECIDGIKRTLGSKHAIDIVYMDTKRRPESEFPAIARRVLNRIGEKKPDLIMCGDDNALKYLAGEFENTELPVVFYGINNNPREYFTQKTLPAHVTGVQESRKLIPLGRMVTTIVPKSKNKILILFDDSQSTSAHIENSLHGQKTIVIEKTSLEWVVLRYFDQWQDAVKQSKGKYDALIVSNHYAVKNRKTERVLSEDEVLSWIGRNSPVPAFGVMPHTVGSGKLVGAKAFTGSEHGADAAKMALQILDGNKKASDLDIMITEPTRYYFNKANLKKFNLTLPENLENRAVFIK